MAKQSHAPKKKTSGEFRGDWHVNHSSMGMGDYYGTGVRAKIGKIIDGVGFKEVSQKNLKTPPKSTA